MVTGASRRASRHAERISFGEAVNLLSLFHAAALAFSPVHVFSTAGYSAWVSGALSGFIGLGIVLLWAAAASIYPKEELPEAARRLLGRPVGWIVNLALWAYFLSATAADVRITGEVLVQLMPETPLTVFVGCTLAFAGVVARLGLEVTARIATFHSGLVLAAFLLVYVTLMPMVEVDAFTPVLEEGWPPVFGAALAPAAHVARTALIAVVAPRLFGGRGATPAPFRRLAGVVLFGGGLAWCYQFSFLLLEQGAFGPEVSMRMTLPALELVREVRIGPFLERVEAALVTVWLPSIFMQVTAFLYAAAVVFQHLLGGVAYRGFVIPLAVASGLASLCAAGDIWELTDRINGPWTAFALAVQTGVPLLLLGARAFGRGGSSGA